MSKLGRPQMQRRPMPPRRAREYPNPVDKHVGSRVRMRRMMLDMSQESLGNELGLTFQQVQKYEKGSNRISASKLQHLALILRVPVAYFFEGAPSPIPGEQSPGHYAERVTTSEVADFFSSSSGIKLVGGFTKIKNQRLRQSIVDLVAHIGGTP